MEVQIPKHHRQPLSDLFGLTDVEAEELLEASKLVGLQSSVQRVAERWAQAAGKTTAEVAPLADVLLSMLRTLETLQVTSGAFSEAVANQVVSLQQDQLDETDAPGFAKRLESFLSVPSLIVTARAFEDRSGFERAVFDSRMFTDLRPIFSAPEEVDLAAAAITHSLQISAYSDSSGISSYFFALDTDDLVRLRSQVDRALDREQNLRRLVTEKLEVVVLADTKED